MSISGLIILCVLLALALYGILAHDGIKSYTIRNTVGIYSLVLGLLAMSRINRCGMIAVYMGIISLILSLLSLFIFKKDFNRCRLLLVLSLIMGTIGVYLSYID